MRLKNASRNMVVAAFMQVVNLLLNFLVRTAFIKYLGDEYLGINGVFTNILTLLSVAELGIGTAIVYALYEPVEMNDRDKICALVKLYKKTYYIIGATILCLGLLLVPILGTFLKDCTLDIKYVRLVYILFLINSCITYLFAHKIVLINVAQKIYIEFIVKYGFLAVQVLIQIIILKVYKNFTVYLCFQIFITFITNFTLYAIATKLFPYLQLYNQYDLEPAEKTELGKNIKAMFFHKIGGAVVTGTDNLLVSKLVSVIVAGKYSNYSLIFNGITLLITSCFDALTASIGNLVITKDIKKIYNTFCATMFLNYIFVSGAAIEVFVFINPFISIWAGDRYVLSKSVVLILVYKFYIGMMRKSVLVFRNAMGLFYYDRYKAVLEAITNLVLSVFLGLKIGISGIFVGTILSEIISGIFIEAYILYKYGFGSSAVAYYKKYLLYLVSFSSVLCEVYIVEKIFPYSPWRFISDCVIALILICLTNFIFYHKSREVITLKNMIHELHNKHIG